MPRPLPPALAAAALFVLTAGPTAAADTPGAIAQAQAHLDRNDGRRAAEVLEAALPGAGAEARGSLLQALRRAYERAIRQAEAEGQTREAAGYRENLAILDRRTRPPAPGGAPSPATAASQDSAGVPAAAAPVGGPAAPDPADAPGPPKPPLSVAAPSHADGPAPASVPGPVPASPEPITGPALLDPGPSTPAPAAPASGMIDPAPTPAPAPATGPMAEPPASAPTAEPAPRPPEARTPDIRAADEAFRAKRYDEAGRIYAGLAREGRLPEVRRDPWAYCRMVAVVERINAGPKTSQDWAAIQAEIAEIRRLSPRNWYAEYLRNLVSELSARGRKSAPGRLVVRGSAPEEPAAGPAPTAGAAQPRGRRAEAPRAALSPPPNPAVTAGRVGQPGQPVNTWQVWETPNFRIFHSDEALAEKVAQIAEATRQTQQRLWAGVESAPNWDPRCDLYLYPTAAVFSKMTGQPEQSPGFSTMGLDSGRVVARRVNLRADHPNLLPAILPHEVTHVVLADLFTTAQIPRWADEGMAVLAEPQSEQDLRAADLAEPLTSGQLFKLGDLMHMDYPDGRYWSLYYAQSVSLTRFLVEQGSPAQFVDFVRAAQRNGVEPELKRVYNIDGVADLERRWLARARSNAGTAAAARVASGGPDSQPARR